MIKELSISSSKRYQLIDITDELERIIKESSIKEGIALIFCSHTTAGILVTENEKGLLEDWLNFFKNLTAGFNFQHNKIDNNADSHIIAGLIGNEKSFIIKEGKLLLGTWQKIFLAELDGPRTRKIIIKIISS